MESANADAHVNFTDPEHDRQVIKPIRHHNLWAMYKQQEAQLWKREEIVFSQDIIDWRTSEILTPEVKQFLLKIIGFFAVSDSLVVKNLIDQFLTEVTVPECKAFYSVQAFIEMVHSETYADMLGLFTEEGESKEIVATPAIQAKAKWAEKYMDSSKPFAVRLWAFCVFEGVLFQASFASMFWLKRKGVCPGITGSNEFIAKDEDLHARFAAAMINMLDVPLTQEAMFEVLKEAVECEEQFVAESLKEDLMGMTKEMLTQYVHFSADRLVKFIDRTDKGKPTPLFDQSNPFKWMEMSDLSGKTNFFERRVTEYESSAVGMDKGENDFELDEDF